MAQNRSRGNERRGCAGELMQMATEIAKQEDLYSQAFGALQESAHAKETANPGQNHFALKHRRGRRDYFLGRGWRFQAKGVPFDNGLIGVGPGFSPRRLHRVAGQNTHY